MLDPKEIEKDVIKLDEPPESYHYLEKNLFWTLQTILERYKAGRINKEQAGKHKLRAIKDYETDKFHKEVMDVHIERIKETELLRIELRKNPIWETAMKLLELYSGETGFWVNLKQKGDEEIEHNT